MDAQHTFWNLKFQEPHLHVLFRCETQVFKMLSARHCHLFCGAGTACVSFGRAWYYARGAGWLSRSSSAMPRAMGNQCALTELFT
jgi:hypothetical protein